MRLLFVLVDDPSRRADRPLDARRVAEGLARRGHTVHALARRAPGEPAAEVRRGVLVRRVPAAPESDRPARALLRALDGALGQADVVALPAAAPEALPAAALARRRGVAALLLHEGGTGAGAPGADPAPDDASGAMPEGPRAVLRLIAGVLAARLARGVLVASHDEAARSPALRLVWDQLHVVGPPSGTGAANGDGAAPDEAAQATKPLDGVETMFQRALDGTL